MKRFRITTWVVSLVLAFGVSLAGTIASAGATALARAASAPAHSAKKHKTKHKKSCPKGSKQKGKVCIETKVVNHNVPGPTVENMQLAEEEAGKRKVAEEAKAAAEKKAAEEKAGREAEAAGKTAAEKKAAEEAAGKAAEKTAKEAAEKKATEEAAGKAAEKTAKEKAEAELKAKVTAEENAANLAKEKKLQEEKELKEKEPLALGEGPCKKAGTAAIEKNTEIPLAPAFTERELNAYPCANYLSSEGGTTGDHFSALKEITPANVGTLKADWVTQLDHAGLSDSSVRHGGEMASVEYEGVLYYSTGTDDVFAVSVASGNILWVHPGEEPNDFGYILNGGGNRGIAIGNGLVYSAVLSGDVEALNQKTGQLEWRTEIGSPTEGVSVTSSPLYYQGAPGTKPMIIIGPVGGEEGVRGFMEALSAETGEVIWKHYDIPAPGEFGHETWPTAATTEHCAVAKQDEEAAIKAGDTAKLVEEETRKGEALCNSEWERGGAVVWFAPTVDDKTGYIYYGTSNAAEDYYGENRYGANLWNCSVLALNVKTGELAWGFQEVHHDVWDDDQGNQPDMAMVEVEGKKIEAVVAVNKDGLVYLLNAATGEPLSDDKVTEKAAGVSANSSYPTQPIPAMPAMHPYEKPTAEQLTELQTKLNTSEASYNKLAEEGKEPTGVLGPITVKAGGAEEKGIMSAIRGLGESTVEVYISGGVQYAVSSYNPESATYVVDGSGSSMSTPVEQLESEPFVQGAKWNGIHTSKITASTGTGYAWVTAYNLDTGKILWQINDNEERLINGKVEKEKTGLFEFGESVGHGGEAREASSNAGTTQTAGGVTFLGNGGGEEMALETATGKLLWHWELGNKIAASASVYEWNGHEYVTAYTSEGGDNLWTWSLNGTSTTQYSLYKTEHSEAGGTPTPTLGEHGYNPAAVEVSKEFLEKGPLPEPCAKGTCAAHEGKEK